MATHRTIVFDVNETLTDQSHLATRLGEVGAPQSLAPVWYAATLRDGIALSLVGAAAPYADVARGVLVGLLAGLGEPVGNVDAAADHVMAGFATIDPHPDVVPGLRALAASGHTLVTLSNGATAVAEGLLERHGVRDCVTHVLSAEDADGWKPHPDAYAYASRCTGVAAGDLLMVAVHPWDLEGAARAGLSTAFLDRTGAPWPPVFDEPDVRVRSLVDLDARLT